MGTFHLINAYQAKQRLDKEQIQVVDIRDHDSYDADHIEDAFHLTNESVASFMKKVDSKTPLFVICYHGNSSKGVAQYLCEQGYTDVYSVEGGMTDWRIVHPHE